MESMKKERVFGSEEAGLMVTKLRETFLTGKTASYDWRMTQLKGLMKIVHHHESDIVKALYSDLSKPEAESMAYEIGMVKNSIGFAMKELRRWMEPEKAKTTLLTFPSSARIVHEPLGVVLVISAWNFPFYLSLDPVVGAISAGNAVVLKPSEISPATSSLLAELFIMYMDTSAIEVVEGSVPQTSALLDQKWDKIFFTGNGNVGRIVMTAAAKNLTPVTLELGGKCPAFVHSNVNLTVAIRRIVGGKWGLNNGQACAAIDHVITTKDFAPILIEGLKKELKLFYGENPMESPDLSRIVNIHHFHRLNKLLTEAKVSGKIVHGGQTDESNLKMAPTIILLDSTEKEQLVMKEEIFGPLLPILQVESIEQGFEMMKFKEKPLAAYLFSNDNKVKDEFVQKVSAGGLLVNDVAFHLANPYLPFGGVGASGFGAYHGKFSFECFSHKKGVLIRSFAGDNPARYPPFTSEKLRLIKALLSGRIIDIIRAMLGI